LHYLIRQTDKAGSVDQTYRAGPRFEECMLGRTRVWKEQMKWV